MTYAPPVPHGEIPTNTQPTTGKTPPRLQTDVNTVVPTAANFYVVPLGRAVFLGEPTMAIVRPILSFPRTRE